MYTRSMGTRRRSALVMSLLLAAQGVFGFSGDDTILRRDYEDTVCQPATKNPSDTVPPCVEVQTIEEQCTPNGTAPLYLQAHAQCMCGGSFFAEWPYCLQCLFVHGLRSQRDVAFYASVIASASSELCGVPTPAADFQDIFSAIQATLAQPTTGATVSSDQFPSQTAVSLYYTASGSQGPGSITGSAAGATATGSTTAGGAAPSKSASGGGSGSSGSGAATTGSGGSSKSASGSSSSSSASASPNAAAALPATRPDSLLIAILGGALALFA